MSETQLELPKGVVKRIVKEKLSGISEKGRDVQLNKEALLAVAESAKVFISYITAAANDLCKEKQRQTLTADDVFAALEELEFQELIPQLRESFEAYKQATKEKKDKKAEASRKRKSAQHTADDTTAAAGGDAAAGTEAGKDTAEAGEAEADDEDDVMQDQEAAEDCAEGAQ